MNVLKAYADSGATGGQNFGLPVIKRSERETANRKNPQSGDSITLSQEARDMLASGGESISVCPQDATYDQHGNMTRQFDSVQSDLRNLAARVMSGGDNPALAGKLGALNYQLGMLKAQV